MSLENYIWNNTVTTTGITTTGIFNYYPNDLMLISQPILERKEGIEMKGLYDVHLIYAEDRKSPIIKQKIGIIADSEEDAKIKSGLMKEIDDTWDADYLTFIVCKIGDVKVKEKPKEVKQV